MTISINGALSRRLAGPALGALIAFAVVPAAMAQWLPPPWRAMFPSEIARSLEAQGYVLTAPLMRRPGVYLADVRTGPAGHQRLIIDARSGVILERFAAPGPIWGSSVAALDDGSSGLRPPWIAGPSPGAGSSGARGPAPAARPAYHGPANVHIPAAISPYDSGATPPEAKPKPRPVLSQYRSPATRAPTVNPPLPPPAPREPSKSDGSDTPASAAGPTEVENVGPASAGPSAGEREKPRVTVVPPALFE